MNVITDILHNMDKKHVTSLKKLDLSAAFDRITHSILLEILTCDIGIDGQAVAWLRSYLLNHTKCININDLSSRDFDLKFGVPHGSCLGPVLFIGVRSGGQ